VVRLKTLPVRVGSGKLDRKRLPIPSQEHRVKLSRSSRSSSSKRKRTDLDRKIIEIWRDVLSREDISYEDNFFDVGGESLLASKLMGHLELELSSETRIHLNRLTVTELYSNPTCSALIKRLLVVEDEEEEQKDSSNPHQDEEEYVAVVGLSGIFPGASDISSFWNNLIQAKDSLRIFTEKELSSKHVLRSALNNDRYVRAGQCISNPDHFDAYFWGMSSDEARHTDPQQRVFLQCAYHAMEDAGIAPRIHESRERTAVFAACGTLVYFLLFHSLTHSYFSLLYRY